MNESRNNQLTADSSVTLDRKNIIYRILESTLAVSTIGSMILFVVLSIISPVYAAIFIIIYSFLWVLKAGLNVIYTIYSYLQYKRWEKVDWPYLIENFDNHTRAQLYLRDMQDRYRSKLDWQKKLEQDIANLDKIQGSKFAKAKDVVHVAVFATYNESSLVLLKSLQRLFDSKWYLDKLIVVVSQEARNGADKNRLLREQISDVDYINGKFLDGEELKESDIELSINQLNVFFTEHPDGMVGEIKGKASNEDWGARQALKLVEENGIDEEMVVVTSLDADSHIGKFFFHNLSYRFCLTLERERSGFQPIHLYSNNFFDTGLFPRQVATQSTLYNLTNLALDGEIYFFAIYSVPLTVLKEVDFWVKDVIAEDYLLFIKCLAHFNGDFKIVPHYGYFEGDAVEAEDYIEEIINQYKQLQRWAWGGVEGFPYLIKRMFLTPQSKHIPLKIKLKWAYLKFSNHFFWVTTPLIFSIGPIIPQLIHGETFRSSAISQNLTVFSQYFAWTSFIFVFAFGYLTFRFLASAAAKSERLSIQNVFTVLIQLIISPLIYGLMSIPALDAQIRGLLGKYMGYWVTPKK